MPPDCRRHTVTGFGLSGSSPASGSPRRAFPADTSLAGQFRQGRQGDVLGIDLEEPPQFLAGLAAAEAVGAQHRVVGGRAPRARSTARTALT